MPDLLPASQNVINARPFVSAGNLPISLSGPYLGQYLRSLLIHRESKEELYRPFGKLIVRLSAVALILIMGNIVMIIVTITTMSDPLSFDFVGILPITGVLTLV